MRFVLASAWPAARERKVKGETARTDLWVWSPPSSIPPHGTALAVFAEHLPVLSVGGALETLGIGAQEFEELGRLDRTPACARKRWRRSHPRFAMGHRSVARPCGGCSRGSTRPTAP